MNKVKSYCVKYVICCQASNSSTLLTGIYLVVFGFSSKRRFLQSAWRKSTMAGDGTHRGQADEVISNIRLIQPV